MSHTVRVNGQQYLFALVDGGGNVAPELSAARRLVARGHAATVLAEDSVMEEVRATGAEVHRWLRAPNRRDRRPENDPARDWECKYRHPVRHAVPGRLPVRKPFTDDEPSAAGY